MGWKELVLELTLLRTIAAVTRVLAATVIHVFKVLALLRTIAAVNRVLATTVIRMIKVSSLIQEISTWHRLKLWIETQY